MEQQKIIEELQSIEAFAELLLKKCYSVRQLLTPGGFNPRASFKKKSQTEINQVIANRNKSIKRKLDKLKSIIVFLFFFSNASSQALSLPSIDSLYNYIDDYYDDLSDSEIEEFKSSTKGHWLQYLPSPGYSPFTGGFSFSLNLSAPIQEAKLRHASKNKITSIRRINKLAAQSLKNEVYTDFKALQNSINEFHLGDTLENLKLEAFKIYQSLYKRNEITPTEYLAREYEIESMKVQRLSQQNNIYKSILMLLLKAKKPAQTNAPGF